MENYFQYFSEIEEHFQRRRGTALLLSTLDWALIETWKEQEVPLPAVLRGIDAAFESYERRPHRGRKINSLAYCTQAVLEAAEEMSEAAIGTARTQEPAFEVAEIKAYLERNAAAIERVSSLPAIVRQITSTTACSLREMAQSLSADTTAAEQLEQRLTVMEEKIFAALVSACSEADLLGMRQEAEREIAPYRSKMQSAQIAQLQKQFLHKTLMERHSLPRLSLFYMK